MLVSGFKLRSEVRHYSVQSMLLPIVPETSTGEEKEPWRSFPTRCFIRKGKSTDRPSMVTAAKKPEQHDLVWQPRARTEFSTPHRPSGARARTRARASDCRIFKPPSPRQACMQPSPDSGPRPTSSRPTVEFSRAARAGVPQLARDHSAENSHLFPSALVGSYRERKVIAHLHRLAPIGDHRLGTLIRAHRRCNTP